MSPPPGEEGNRLLGLVHRGDLGRHDERVLFVLRIWPRIADNTHAPAHCCEVAAAAAACLAICPTRFSFDAGWVERTDDRSRYKSPPKCVFNQDQSLYFSNYENINRN